MFLSDRFVCATKEYSQLDAPVPAPYLRREFHYDGHSAAELTITGLGFYELFINGTKITRGRLSPYISNSSQLIYYDCYDIRPYLVKGCNAIGVLLGNGMQNCFGGFVWDFDKTPYRTAPLLALALELDGQLVLEANEQFLTHPSPILEDDLRLGADLPAGTCASLQEAAEGGVIAPAAIGIVKVFFVPMIEIVQGDRETQRCVGESFGESELQVDGQFLGLVVEGLHLSAEVAQHQRGREIILFVVVVEAQIHAQSYR